MIAHKNFRIYNGNEKTKNSMIDVTDVNYF